MSAAPGTMPAIGAMPVCWFFGLYGQAEDLAEFAEAEAREHAGGEGGIGVAGTGGR